MDTTDTKAGHAPRPETEGTEAERQDRFAWEAEGIAEARAELDAGLYVDADEMRAWIDSLRTDAPPLIARRAAAADLRPAGA